MASNDRNNYLDMALFEKDVPLFKEGLAARDKLATDGAMLSRAEKLDLRRKARAGEEAWLEISERAEWVINKAVSKEMDRPRTFHVMLDPEELHQAGLEAIWKMLKAIDLDKMNSPVNYLMQWVNTLVERTASKDEAEFGVTGSKINKFRKIAAIRAKLRKKIGREPTDEEVYEFVKAGGGKVKTMNGRLKSKTDTKPNDDDAPRYSLELIIEQGKLNNGSPMRFAITDPVAIDAETNTGDDTGKMLEPPNVSFWRGWMKHVGIREDQWDKIAASLSLYDVDDEITASKRLADEAGMLIGSSTGGIVDYAREWSQEHGPGPWDVFANVTMGPPIAINGVDEKGHKIFRVLKFDKAGAGKITPSHGGGKDQ